jgi:hypothetical protein
LFRDILLHALDGWFLILIHVYRWTGKCWSFYNGLRYEFDLEFEVRSIKLTFLLSICWLNLFLLYALDSCNLSCFKSRALYSWIRRQDVKNVQVVLSILYHLDNITDYLVCLEEVKSVWLFTLLHYGKRMYLALELLML